MTSKAMQDVIDERNRQKQVEGWDADHDDQHTDGQIAQAAGCYALFSNYPRSYPVGSPPVKYWPWEDKWWKPSNYRRSLVKAAALLIAEIERLDRKEQP